MRYFNLCADMSKMKTGYGAVWWDTYSPAVIYAYNNGGWQRLYRGPAAGSFEPCKQEEITKEDIDALL